MSSHKPEFKEPLDPKAGAGVFINAEPEPESTMSVRQTWSELGVEYFYL